MNLLSKQGLRTTRILRAMAVFWVCLIAMPGVLADGVSERRALVGLNLFRTFVSADQQLETRANANGQLVVYLLYVSRDDNAERHREKLQESMPSIRDRAVQLSVMSLDQLLQTKASPAAVFVSERLNEAERESLVQFSIDMGFPVFSPFDGDVQRGILGGVSVAARVQPSINMTTLKRSGIQLKPFYLNVARQYP